MLEIGTLTELKAEAGELAENTDSEFSEITFEELLAQEKKDAFWLVILNGCYKPIYPLSFTSMWIANWFIWFNLMQAKKWKIQVMLKLIAVTSSQLNLWILLKQYVCPTPKISASSFETNKIKY